MKKSFTFMFTIMFAFTFSSCEVIDANQPNESLISYEDIHPGYGGYATNITITEETYEESLPEKDFKVEITKIKYTPITNIVEVEYTIKDEYYQNATYYTVGRKANSSLNETKIQHVLTSRTGSFRDKFSGEDLSTEFMILFGKFDDDDLNPWPNAVAVKTITMIDHKKDDRHQVFLVNHEFDEFIIDASTTHLRLDYTLKDEHQMIEKLDVILIENVTHIEVEKISLTIDDLSRDGDHLKFSDISFTKAKSGMKYDVIVVAAGHDGIDEFKEIVINVFRYTTGS
ncbi:MAG: hypothetical protein NUK62_00795 [Tenericutes bacterium]|jgi:hypothetical protein|nr:hypothetical protein [Mycoplasmatota bacterium]